MIQDPISYAKHKLNSMIASFAAIGVIFILLGIAIIFVPQIVQYIFVLGFVLVGMFSCVIALRISHLRDVVEHFDVVGKLRK